jgi:hypothetical protein
LAYTQADYDAYLDSVVLKINNSSSREGAQLQAANGKAGLDTLVNYGSIGPDQQAEGWLVIDGALANYNPPVSAAPPNVQPVNQPTVSSQPTYSQQPGVSSSGSSTMLNLLQQFGIVKPKEEPWYTKPEYVIPASVAGIVLIVAIARAIR